MPKRGTGPGATVVTLFRGLSEEGKQIVFDLIRAEMATPRKASNSANPTAPDAPRRSSRRNATEERNGYTYSEHRDRYGRCFDCR